MGNARGWLIGLAVLAAGIPLASILPVGQVEPTPTRVDLRIETGPDGSQVWAIEDGAERPLAFLVRPNAMRPLAVQREDATLTIRDHLTETLGPRTFDSGETREDAVLAISADHATPWGDVLWLIAVGQHPELRIVTFELDVTGTDLRYTWVDPTLRDIAATPMMDVVELRVAVGASGTYLLDLYQDRIAPFMVGMFEEPGETRSWGRVLSGPSIGDFARPGWGEDALLRAVRNEAEEEIADGFLRLGFVDLSAFGRVRMFPVRTGPAIAMLMALDRLEPAAVFLGAGDRA